MKENVLLIFGNLPDAVETATKVNNRRLLSAFWITRPEGIPQYFGVSAYSLDDAFDLLQEAGFKVDRKTAKIIENVKTEDLDQEHVVPNMGVIVQRGVWYPNLNA